MIGYFQVLKNGILLFLLVQIAMSCGKNFELRPPKKVTNVLGGHLEEVRSMEGESIILARKVCAALAQKRYEIRPGLQYHFSVNDRTCVSPTPISLEIMGTLEDGEEGWEWKLEQNVSIKFFKKMLFENSSHFEKLCRLLKEGNGESIKDTIEAGNLAQKFLFSKVKEDETMVQVDLIWAYQSQDQVKETMADPKKADWVVQKREHLRVHLGGIGRSGLHELSSDLPAGTVMLRTQEELCKRGSPNNVQQFAQKLLKIN